MVKFDLQTRRDGDLLRAELIGQRSPLQSVMARHSQEAWDAITQAAAERGDGPAKPLSLSNTVLLASGTA